MTQTDYTHIMSHAHHIQINQEQILVPCNSGGVIHDDSQLISYMTARIRN